jgi:RimJ/RimL family protein N-acetyltransferase
VAAHPHNVEPALDIHTNRLDIRSLSGSDELLFCKLFTDADTMRYIGPQLSADRAASGFRMAVAFTGRRPAERLFFSVAVRAQERKIGICSIQQIDPVLRRAEVGVVLESFARAQGFAREILPALVSRALTALPVDEIWLQYSKHHSLAERLFASAGFSRCLDPAAYGQRYDKRVWSARRNKQVNEVGRTSSVAGDRIS